MAEDKIFNLLGKYSYSRLEKYINCPYAYKLAYVDGKYVSANSLALGIGTLLHKVNEYICSCIINKVDIDYDKVLDFIDNAGPNGPDLLIPGSEKGKDEEIRGVNLLKKEFFEDWLSVDTKSGKSMKQKIKDFCANIHYLEDEFKNSDWKPYKVEDPFEFNFKGVTFKGFIDRIDINEKTGALRVIDYKTKDKAFDSKELATPLQFVVYAMAVMNKYGKMPEEFIYDLPLINVKQEGGTKGFFVRGEKKMNTILENIENDLKNKEFKPKPSPLCYYCPYNCTGCQKGNAHDKACEYYSLWTPQDKNFSVNKEYGKKFTF